jgi:hypothetical protein
MNSLCDGTGNQFGHIRETNSRQQGIKSATSGNWARDRFSLDGSSDSITVVPATAATFAGMTVTFPSHPAFE